MSWESGTFLFQILSWAVIVIGNIWVLKTELKSLRELSKEHNDRLLQHTTIVTEHTTILREHERRITKLEEKED